MQESLTENHKKKSKRDYILFYSFFSKRWQQAGIRFKYIISVLSLFLMGVIPITYFFVDRSDFLLRNGLKDKLSLVEKNVSIIVKSSLIENSFTTLTDLIASISRGDREIVSIYVLDKNYSVLSSSNKKYGLFADFIRGKETNQEVVAGLKKAEKNIFYTNNGTLLHKISYIKLIDPSTEEDKALKDPQLDDAVKGIKHYNSAPTIKELDTKVIKKVQLENTEFDAVLIVSLKTYFLDKEISKLRYIATAALLITLLLGIYVANMISSRMSSPLISLASKVNTITDGNLVEPVILPKPRGDEIGNLFKNVDAMRLAIKSLTGNLEETVLQRTAELHVSQQENTRILETMTTGLFSIDRSYIIGTQYSKVTEKVLRTNNLAKQPLLEVCKHIFNEERLRMFEKYLTILFNPAIVDAFVGGLNPIQSVEIKVGTAPITYLEFSFLRILKDNKIIGIMALIDDITDSFLLNQKLVEQEKRLSTQVKQIHAVLNVDPKFLSVFIADADDDLSRLSELSSQGEISPEELGEVYRIVHSIKGNASVLHLDFVAAVTHECEEKIIQMQKKAKITHDDISEINVILVEIKKVLEGINELIVQLSNFQSNFKNTGSDISKMTVDSIVQMVDKISIALQKSVQMDLSKFDYAYINDTTRKSIKDILIQMVRNSISHGIEDFKERKESGKPMTATITLTSKRDGDYFWACLQDDGKGLSMNRLREKAVSMGLATDREIHSWEDSKVQNLIFMPGFSTKEKADMHSGRGVGMDIIKNKIEDLGGQLIIKSVEGKGLAIYIGLPLSLYENV